jgi:hypothetical protein
MGGGWGGGRDAENIDNATNFVVNYKNQNFTDYSDIYLDCVLYNVIMKQ